jgi:hypothetical protein
MRPVRRRGEERDELHLETGDFVIELGGAVAFASAVARAARPPSPGDVER